MGWLDKKTLYVNAGTFCTSGCTNASVLLPLGVDVSFPIMGSRFTFFVGPSSGSSEAEHLTDADSWRGRDVTWAAINAGNCRLAEA